MTLTAQTLGEICDEVKGIIRTGPFGSQLHRSDYQNEGTPVVMPKDIIDGKVSTESIARVGDEHIKRLAQHKLKLGDIVYARRGDIGRRALITNREQGWLCGTGCLRVSLGNSVLEPLFLHYYLAQSQVINWIYNQAIGATMPNLNTDIMRSVPITYPPLPTQRKIAAILSAYDDLIENNARRIAILEALAQALYREWFVEFSFPGHEQIEMVESELGLVPAGWRIKAFGDVSLNFDRKRIPVSSRDRAEMQGEYPYYGASGIIDYVDDYIFDGRYLLIAEDGENLRSRKKPLAFFATGKFWVNNHAHIVQGKYPISSNFLQLLVDNLDISPYITGAAQPKLSQTNLNRIPVIVAPDHLQKRFNAFVGDCFTQIENLQTKNENLRQTRDLLLPRLVSGEVDVSELEIDIGEEI